MSTNDLRAGQLLPDHLLEGPGHVTSTADRHLTGRPPAHHKSRSRGLANIDPKFTSQVRQLYSLLVPLYRYDGCPAQSGLKGTVSRDFLLLVFFMNHLPPSP
jgi:hypothetical protein